MALASARVSPVRVSWDTQQRLPYNRNAPRKIKKPDSFSFSSVLPSTFESKQNSRLQIDVDGLLKLNAANPRQGTDIPSFVFQFFVIFGLICCQMQYSVMFLDGLRLICAQSWHCAVHG